MEDLEAGPVPSDDQRAATCASHRGQRGDASGRPAHLALASSRRPNPDGRPRAAAWLLASSASSACAFRRATPAPRASRAAAPSVSTPPAARRRPRPPASATGSARKASVAEPPAAEGRLQQQEQAISATTATDQHGRASRAPVARSRRCTSAWYSSGKFASAASPLPRLSATAPHGRARRRRPRRRRTRDTDSCRMTSGSDDQPTSATSPRRTVPPSGCRSAGPRCAAGCSRIAGPR